MTDSENKVKEAIKIERAHRVDKRKKVGGKQQSKEEKENLRAIMLWLVIVLIGIRELMQTTFLNGGRKMEVNISHTRTVISHIFKQIGSTS